MGQTPFVETEVLLAVLDDCIGDALRMLQEMHPEELMEFRRRLAELQGLARRVDTRSLSADDYEALEKV